MYGLCLRLNPCFDIENLWCDAHQCSCVSTAASFPRRFSYRPRRKCASNSHCCHHICRKESRVSLNYVCTRPLLIIFILYRSSFTTYRVAEDAELKGRARAGGAEVGALVTSLYCLPSPPPLVLVSL